MTNHLFMAFRAALYGLYVIGLSSAVALIVFGLAYAQQITIWSWTVSLGPDLYVSAAMALFAFAVTAWTILREG
jgi:hypothetical protein